MHNPALHSSWCPSPNRIDHKGQGKDFATETHSKCKETILESDSQGKDHGVINIKKGAIFSLKCVQFPPSVPRNV
jgi:hypothetical protein